MKRDHEQDCDDSEPKKELYFMANAHSAHDDELSDISDNQPSYHDDHIIDYNHSRDDTDYESIESNEL